MTGPPPIDFDLEELRCRYLAKRDSSLSLNNQVDGPALLSMAGNLDGLSVLEIGCGAGELAQLLAECRLKSYVGMDISSAMVGLAKKRVIDPRFDFQVVDVENGLITGGVDVVISALAFHFLTDLDGVLCSVRDALAPGGRLAFSIRHPLRTCNPSGLAVGGEGWNAKDYFQEGVRTILWHEHTIHVFHRTVSTILTAVLGAGFSIVSVAELRPELDRVLEPDRDHCFVPGLLHICAVKPS